MAFLRKKSKTPAKLVRMLGDTEVPVFRDLTLSILERLREPEVDFVEVAEALQWDPSLVAQVLRTVNSTAYSPAAPIADVRHAASYMGRAALEQIVTALAVKAVLPTTPVVGYEPRAFWLSAATRAALARQLAGRLHPATESEVFAAGLLSDLAVPILAHGQPDTYGPLLKDWQDGGIGDLSILERSEFGWDHGRVGAELARHWALPEGLVGSIGCHHREEVDDRTLAPALRLVSLWHQTAGEAGAECMLETARDEYGLTSDWLVTAVDSSRDQARELLQAFG